MGTAAESVVVDTSVAIEVLVEEAPCRVGYSDIFDALRRSGTTVVFCDLLEAELIEAAYTWDL